MASNLAKKKAKQSIDVAGEKTRVLSIWDLVSKELRAKVGAGDEATIEFLTRTFPSSTYPAKGSDSTHCVYCHKTFDPRLPGPCSMEHEWDEGDRYQKWPPRYSFNCSRCEASEDVEEDDCPSGYCREGVCSDDIYDRMDEGWHGLCGDEADDFDGCSVCCKLKENVDKDEESDEDDEESDEDDEESDEDDEESDEDEVETVGKDIKNAAVEVIVIDD